MQSTVRRNSGLLAAALMTVMATMGSAAFGRDLSPDQTATSAPSRTTGSGISRRRHGNAWGNRHQQRLAQKRRNVLRNRRAHRG